MSNAVNRAKDPEYNGNTDASVGTDIPSVTVGTKSNDTKKEEDFYIKTSPIPFKSTCDSTILTTIDLGQMVNGIFKKAFKDYDGCIVYREAPSNLWKVTLYFKENINANAVNAIKNLERVGKIKDSDGNPLDIGQRIEAFANISSNKSYRVTKATTDVISKYYMNWQKNKDGSINWKHFIFEGSEGTAYAYNTVVPYVQINGLDLIELMKDIYGRTNDEDHYIEYEVNAIRPLVGGVQTNNYLMQLTRYDSTNIDALAAKVGIVPVIGQLPIIR